MNKWIIYIMSAGNITLKESKIIAPRIGVCADNIKMINSNIDSSF
jgi:hypothetical protein